MTKRIIYVHNPNVPRSRRLKAKRALKAARVAAKESVKGEDLSDLPMTTPRLWRRGFFSFQLFRPAHRATGTKLAAANPFAAADMFEPAGPVIGVEMLSGGAPFTFDLWELYLRGIVSSPNLLIQGSLRQGKSFIIKRIVVLMAAFGRFAINTSDSKGEHGAVALAIGGQVFKMGSHGSTIRINPLDAPARRAGEDEYAFSLRVKASRVAVLQQIVTLLNPGGRDVSARETTILDWAIDRAVAATGDRPTITDVWQIICSEELLKAEDGYFSRSDAQDISDGLRRIVIGDLAGMFETHSTISLDPTSPYTVIDTSAISERGSQALALTQAVSNAWVQGIISNKDAGRRYFLIREEGWRDMKTATALEAHQEQLKLSGEYGIAMVLIVHEDGDFDSVGAEGSKERELAKSLLRGYANRICFNQPEPTLRNAVASGVFSQAEADAIKACSRGQFLVKLKHRSYVVDGNASTTAWEKKLFDTDKQMRADSMTEGAA